MKYKYGFKFFRDTKAKKFLETFVLLSIICLRKSNVFVLTKADQSYAYVFQYNNMYL